MSRFELQGWPLNRWEQNTDTSGLLSAREWFRKALELHPGNRTARHRLGLIAMRARDFETASLELGQAFALDPGHRGVRKSLGYSLAWSGRVGQAAELLDAIPEARHELLNYIGWWRQLGRLDLAESARQTAELLNH
jgi:predicted Zn-dependent protease